MFVVCVLLSLFLHQSRVAFAASSSGIRDDEGKIQTVGWQASPTTRGTWSIIVDCLFTLTLCVYTGIHPNVPRQNSRYVDFLWTRVKWVSVGIIAPELVVYTAWRQWRSARHLNQQLTNSKKDRALSMETIPGPSFLGNWSMAHSFFVVMGGYVIVRKDEKNLTITPKGVERMIDLGYELPRLSHNDIQDRSKADPITKLFTCVQATYMIAQVIGRRAANLPITMLEINTIGHVVCALVMFLFWFQKPLNIEVPVFVEEDWLNNQQQRLTQKTQGFWSPAFWKRPREHQVKLHRRTGTLTPTVTIREDNLFLLFLERLKELKLLGHIVQASSSDEEVLEIPIQSGPPPLNAPWKPTDVILVITEVSDSQTQIQATIAATHLWPWLTTHVFRTSDTLSSLYPAHATTLIHNQALRLYLPLPDILKWDLAWRNLVTFADAFTSPTAYAEWRREFDSQACAHEYTTPLSRNWPSNVTSISNTHPPNLLAISLLSLATGAYGGLHLLLWSSYFPSTVERNLWRVSACIIAASGLLAGYLVLLIHSSSASTSEPSTPLPRTVKVLLWPTRQLILLASAILGRQRVGRVTAQGTLIAAFVLGPCYVAARLYIVIESFVGLRRVQSGVYQVAQWSNLWPHV